MAALRTDRWRWLQLMASQYGPADPATRHVLMTISLHMAQHGGNAWPSQRLIALRSGLSERSVRAHIAKARKADWLLVYIKGMTGKAWRHYEYIAAIPDTLANIAPDHPWETDPTWQRAANGSAPAGDTPETAQGAANGAEGAATIAEGAAINDTKVRNHLPTNLPSESIKNQTVQGALKRTTRDVFQTHEGRNGRDTNPMTKLKPITDESLWKRMQLFEQVGDTSVESVIKQLAGSFQDITTERIWRVLAANGRGPLKQQRVAQ